MNHTYATRLKKIASCYILISWLVGYNSRSWSQEGAWIYKSPIPTGRGFTSGAVMDGKIYVIGGFPSHYTVTGATERYDPVTDQWTEMDPMPQGRCEHATCAYHDKIYVFGGLSPSPYGNANKNVYEFDPQTNIWIEKADMPYANAFCGIAVLNDTIYLIGGMNNYRSKPISRMMAYEPVNEIWSEKAPMPTARGWFTACVTNGKIYAIGGTNEDYHSVSYKMVEVYDPTTNTWTTKTDIPTGRAGLATCVLDGKIYAVGGYRYPATLSENLVYNPITDEWIQKSSLQTKRHTCFLGSVADKIYAISGSYPIGNEPMILNSVEEYDPLSDPIGYTSADGTAVFNPRTCILDQNYPNPFNPMTTIAFHVPEAGFITLKIYDSLGREITTLVHETRTAGSHSVTWNGGDHPAGIYLLRMKAGMFTETRKMVLEK